MYRTVPVVVITFVLLSGVAAAADHTLAVQETIDEEDYTLFEDEGVVQYPATYTREETEDGEWREVATYENTTLDDWIFNQARSVAQDEIYETIIDEYGEPGGLMIGITASGINVTYLEYEDADREPDRPFTYEELDAFLPEAVDATIHIEDYTDTVTVPVNLQTGSAPQHDIGDTDERTEDRDNGYDQPQIVDEPSLLVRILSALRGLLPF